MVCGCLCGGDEQRQPVSSIKPYSERHCTDVLFLAAFMVFWAGTAWITQVATAQGGDPNRIVHGTNLEGLVCGVSAGVEEQPFAAWPFPAAYDAQICVASCGDTQTDTARMAIRYPSRAFGSYCIPDPSGLLNATAQSAAALSPEFESGAATLLRAIADVQTAYPVEAVALAAALVLSFVYLMVLRKFAASMVWGLIVVLFAAGAVGGWALLQKASDLERDSPASKDAEWLRGLAFVVLGLTCLFVVVVVFLRNRIQIAVEVMKESARALSHMPLIALFPVFAFVLLGAYLVFWVIVALYIYSVADTEVVPTPITVQYDLFSGARLSNADTMVTYNWRASFRNTFALHFFGLLWNVAWLQYFAYFVVAGAVADWYFTPRGSITASYGGANSATASVRSRRRPGPAATTAQPPHGVGPHGAGHKAAWSGDANAPHTNLSVASDNVVSFNAPAGNGNTNGHGAAAAGNGADDELSKRAYSTTPLWDSLKRTLRFHVGTIAFGALLIAIVQFVRAVVNYLERKTKTRHNPLQRALFCCVQCCLRCVECCVDKISKNAFIWTAIWGDPFPVAVCASFQLIWRNLGRVAALNLVSGYLMGVGKVVVALTTTVGAGVVLTRWPEYADAIENPFVPCLVVFVLSYFVATVFMTTFEVVVDTVFFCFMVDSELNGSHGKPMMASVELQELVGAHHDASKQIADHEQAGRHETVRR